MRDRQLPERAASGGRELHQNLTPVHLSWNARNRALVLEPFHQFHSAVMLDKHARREFANGRPHALGQAVDRQQELMLLRLHAVLPGRQFTEMQKPADLAAKFSQIPVLIARQVIFHDLYRITIQNCPNGDRRVGLRESSKPIDFHAMRETPSLFAPEVPDRLYVEVGNEYLFLSPAIATRVSRGKPFFQATHV